MLSIGQGTLSLAETDNLTQVSGDGTNQVRLIGTVDAVNRALDGMTYQAVPDFNGTASLQISVNDSGNTGSGGPLTAAGQVGVTVLAVNDGPLVTLGTNPVTVMQDSGPRTVAQFATAIAGPPDEIASGQVVTGLAITGNDNPGLFSASPAINAAGTLTFTSAPNRFGRATISLTATDNGGTARGGSDTRTVTFDIVILSDNNPPVVTSPFPDVAVAEDAANTVIPLGQNGSRFFADADGEPLIITAQTDNPELVAVSVVNDQLILDYQPDKNGTAIVQVTAADPETTTSTTFSLAVSPVNDAPVHRLPGPQTTARNTALVFSASRGNQISVTDVDVGIGAIQTTVQVTQGMLLVGQTEGSNVSGDGTARVTIHGPLGGVNTALDGLTYQPVTGFTGSVTLSITTDDLGNTGAGVPAAIAIR